VKRRPETSERALVDDILAGMSSKDLMEKHHLTLELLRAKIMELMEAKLIKADQIPSEAYLDAASAKLTATVRPVTPLSSWGLPAPREVPDDHPARFRAFMFRANAQHTGVRFSREGRRIKGLQWVVMDLAGGYEPCVTDEAVYLPAADGLHALDARSGATLWKFRPPRRPRGTPAVAEGRVYFGSEDGTLFVVDAQTGAQLWKFTTGMEESCSPILTDDLVLCTNENGYLLAIDRETGRFRWQFQAQRFILHPPAVAGGVIYFSDMDNVVYAVHGWTGRPHWMTSTGGGLLTAPVISGGKIYFGSADKHLYALDARSGYDRWSFKADKAVVWAPCVYDETVYFGTLGGRFYALDAQAGSEKWQVNARKRITGASTVVDGVLYFGVSNRWRSGPRNKLFALDPATGRTLWEHSTKGALSTSPAVANGLVYFSTLQEGFSALGCGGPEEGSENAPVETIPSNEPEWFRYLLGSAIITVCALLWGMAMTMRTVEVDPEHWTERISLLQNWVQVVLCLLGTGYLCLPLIRKFSEKPRALIGWGMATLGLVPLLTGLGFMTRTLTHTASGLVPGWVRRMAWRNSSRQQP
jgi:eukaryotic-like serine/threonine-protein kinase